MSDLTAARLRELLFYDPEAGAFTWAADRRKMKIGAVAGCVRTSDGYTVIRVDDKLYLAHRLAWLYMTGEWPSGMVDHIDCDRRNTKFANLRETTSTGNIANRARQKNNSTGFKGVTRNSRGFQAQIMVNRKNLHLGTFRTAEEAHLAYRNAADRHFGAFANPG